MCGRYTLINKTYIKKKFNINIFPNYNIAPKTQVLVLNREIKPIFINWSYSPLWAKHPMNLINARSETINIKPSFKNCSRCIIIANGWYEWQRKDKKKIPYYFYSKNNLIFFAGICNKTSGCAIVTKEANKKISFVHNRQPVLLEENDFNAWLNGEDCFLSISSKEIEYYQVSSRVNNTINNLHDLIQPELIQKL